ncbi:SYG [Hepatospora eriocheir]|uniref:SYG n=1 Tax=Hepatospora eriocheir TaxID=1081669 RepID=A0A1X0Q6D9_9MICR|nr:SYG [Hepatospora eriocheir]
MQQDKKEILDQLFKRKFFIGKVNYPPQNGLYDYGPCLVTIKNEIINAWRRIMIDENMYEIDASVLVPYDVLKNSGHVDRFCDIVLTDGVTTFRADHLIEEKVGEYHMVPININEDTLKQVD